MYADEGRKNIAQTNFEIIICKLIGHFPFQIGVWKSWQKEGLDIKDIVWPGNSHTPPQGVPEKFHLKITFLEEPPFISLAPPDPITGKCAMDRGVSCRVASDADITE
jgi:glutamate receptor ionotropic, NMDA 2B